VVRRERLTAWGEPADGTWINGPGFTRHRMDAASKLVYMQQRYYDPMVGMFLSVDPVTALSNPVGYFNRYRYAADNPYRFADPDGRCYTSTGECMTEEEFDAAWRGEAGRVLNAIGSPLGTVADVLNGEWQDAVTGIVLSRIPLGKQASKYVDEIVDLAKTHGTRIKRGRQIDVEGSIDDIFEDMTRGGEHIGGGRVRLEDGTVVGRHRSTKGDKPETIDVHRDGNRYKIRVRPPPPPPPPPKT
jgi:RHS repeat-associated protein